MNANKIKVRFAETNELIKVKFAENEQKLGVKFGEVQYVTNNVIPKDYGKITYTQNKTIIVS